MKYSPTERIGISATDNIITSDFRWIFREQPTSDMGIDAQIEVVNETSATGNLIALQIKTGESYWKENATDENITFYIDNKHYSYWLGHSLPVFVILHNDNTKETIWQVVDESTVEKTEKQWKVSIPKTNLLSKEFIPIFEAKTPAGVYAKKELQLKMHLPLLNAIRQGKSVTLETNEWCDKTVNRGEIKITIASKSRDSEEFKWPFYSGKDMPETLQHFFPWCHVSIDEDWYNSNYDEPSVRSIYNELPNIYPWIIRSGTYAEYRLRLSLNELGAAYLKVSDFLNK